MREQQIPSSITRGSRNLAVVLLLPWFWFWSSHILLLRLAWIIRVLLHGFNSGLTAMA
jgi:hypothetical protein